MTPWGCSKFWINVAACRKSYYFPVITCYNWFSWTPPCQIHKNNHQQLGLLHTSWWFQPLWKILGKMSSSSPIFGVKMIFHHLVITCFPPQQLPPPPSTLATVTSEAKVDVDARRTRCAKLTPLGARPEKKVGHFRTSSASWPIRDSSMTSKQRSFGTSKTYLKHLVRRYLDV